MQFISLASLGALCFHLGVLAVAFFYCFHDEKRYKYSFRIMAFKLAVILLLSFAIAFCAFTCDPQKPQASGHCQKPMKDSSKSSIGCCHVANGVVEKNTEVYVSIVFWHDVIALLQNRDDFHQGSNLHDLSPSPPPTQAILRI